jgi:hypothetical protein
MKVRDCVIEDSKFRVVKTLSSDYSSAGKIAPYLAKVTLL